VRALVSLSRSLLLSLSLSPTIPASLSPSKLLFPLLFISMDSVLPSVFTCMLI
jgi:hypothetical protein